MICITLLQCECLVSLPGPFYCWLALFSGTPCGCQYRWSPKGGELGLRQISTVSGGYRFTFPEQLTAGGVAPESKPVWPKPFFCSASPGSMRRWQQVALRRWQQSFRVSGSALALSGVAVATCTVSNRTSLQCNSAVQPKDCGGVCHDGFLLGFECGVHPFTGLAGGFKRFWFSHIGNSNPNLLIFFKGVETTNQWTFLDWHCQQCKKENRKAEVLSSPAISMLLANSWWSVGSCLCFSPKLNG